MTQHYLRLFSSVPDGSKPPGIHPDWPVTHFPVPDGDLPPMDGLLGPLTDEEFAQYLEDERPAYDAANAANAAAQLVWYETPLIPGAKTARFTLIDEKTVEVINRGFEFESKTFSLSLSAQMKILGAYSAAAIITYPIIWNTIDDLDIHQLDDATVLGEFYEASVNAVRAALDAGTALKDQIRNATTLAEIAAVEDTR